MSGRNEEMKGGRVIYILKGRAGFSWRRVALLSGLLSFTSPCMIRSLVIQSAHENFPDPTATVRRVIPVS